ncbi:uncharacterized protein CC84DRAFT_1086404 [Paraphaeosphaeria sporulosa]|uniref:F-box domain-containing protein n=1 Tax=Paraphaeosphaeria sporulosa TaxID=1460663 RepID=A0A177CMV8_9PLEO|nr:uncharacterized protein CC84DRAFT_1086404 [Paraphaeosphaeria sporulosa]OAG08107.1 hypothetical protein CC84DRAFT_1086404 [Paraphaeosphaeria sporulosa]
MAYDTYEIPRLTRTPWEVERYKRNSVWKRAPQEAQLPQHVFKNLPREVYDCVLEWLELQYFGKDQHCPPCYLRDLCSLSLTSRAWDRAATIQLYRKIHVLSHEDGCRLPKLRVAGTSRLKLLRRTLREHTALAKIVREIHLPDLQALYSFATIEREEIVNLVASLVMACPSLERLVGFHIPYTHTFDRLSYALSTRPNLKERLWVIADANVEEDEYDDGSVQGYYHAACDPTEKFLELNTNLQYLSTLVLHQESARPVIDLTYRAVIGTIRQLPLLRHLSLSGLSSSSFPNLALSALPPDLLSLRLENLPGINEKGLQRLSSSYVVTSLKTLALIDLEINNLDVLAAFLSPHLQHLEKFTLCQHRAPTRHAGSGCPIFRSNVLKSVHWELRSQVTRPPTTQSSLSVRAPQPLCCSNEELVACLATGVLANSIKDGLLPGLRRIRAPHDPQGVLQALCKPLGTALFRSDTSHLAAALKLDHSSAQSTLKNPEKETTCSLKEFLNTAPDGRADSVMLSPSSARFASHLQDIPQPTPARSRLAAHARILCARENPAVAVRVTDPEDNVRVETNIGGFLGDLRSNITYDLKPDRNREAVDEDEEYVHEWITGIDDVMGEWEVASSSSGCRHAAGGNIARSAVEIQDLF